MPDHCSRLGCIPANPVPPLPAAKIPAGADAVVQACALTPEPAAAILLASAQPLRAESHRFLAFHQLLI